MRFDAQLTATPAGYEFSGLTDQLDDKLRNRVATQLLSTARDGRGSDLETAIVGGQVKTSAFLVTLLALFFRRVLDQLATFALDVQLTDCQLVEYRPLSGGALMVTLSLTGGPVTVVQTLELGNAE